MAQLSENIRVFIAIDTDPVLRKELTHWQRELALVAGYPRWSRPEGLHFTLKFLGEIPFTQLGTVTGVMDALAANESPFQLVCAGGGAFPGIDHPRILWAGVTDGIERLGRLAAQLQDLLEAKGFPREDRPFTAHLTVARVKETHPDVASAQKLADALRESTGRRFGALEVRRLVLMKTDVDPNGSHYTVIHESVFGGTKS